MSSVRGSIFAGESRAGRIVRMWVETGADMCCVKLPLSNCGEGWGDGGEEGLEGNPTPNCGSQGSSRRQQLLPSLSSPRLSLAAMPLFGKTDFWILDFLLKND